jgi:uncharacterized repeat protein (TIGR01451 family)
MRRSTPNLGLTVLTVLLGLATIGLTLASGAGAQAVPTADLAIVSNTASVEHAKVGDQITFTIIAKNNGPDAADFNVMWTSEQLQLVSETCDLGISADTPACEYGIVDPGQSRTTIVVAEVISISSKHAVGTACVVEQAGFINDPDSQNNCAAATVKIVGMR